MSNPVAVLISDVHYTVATLALADAAMRQAVEKANVLRVPLIVAGDLHDTKANLRGECITAMIETFKGCQSPPFIMVGNHDKINEKSETHSLEFLRAYAAIIDYLPFSPLHKVGYLIPYQHDPEILKSYIRKLPPRSKLIMHQGLEKTNSGHYIQDKSAIAPEDVAGHLVISGHYHTRQTINLPDFGRWDYIGNPYSLNFAEANDPPKGFQILMDDSTLEFVPTNLRKHVVITQYTSDATGGGRATSHINPGDLVWVKLSGSKENLLKWNKEKVAQFHELTEPFRLDLIPDDTKSHNNTPKNVTKTELLDAVIDGLTNTSDDRKLRLKEMWKQCV